MRIDLKKNNLICGDNENWIRNIPDESIDLCYIDPPFFTGKPYEIIWGNGYEKRSFEDRFSGGQPHYLEWLKRKIVLIHQKLKKSGTIFIHCDFHANYKIRCLLDEIFDKNFQSEIIWKRTSSHSDSHTFGNIHDTIYFYSKSKKFKFNIQTTEFEENYIIKNYSYKDLDGRKFKASDLTGAGQGPARKFGNKLLEPPSGRHWMFMQEGIDEALAQNRIYWSKNGIPRLKNYLDESEGRPLQTLWDDILGISTWSEEKMDYPTQKPEALIRRIIECASDEGDLVLDCFVGGGTSAKVCSDLKRRFIVGDVSPVAIKLTAERLNLDCPETEYKIKNLPKTTDEFRKIGGHDFADLVCDLMGWKVNSKKSGEKGIDGWDGGGNPVQIKNSEGGQPALQNLFAAVLDSGKKRGVFVAWKFSRPCISYASEVKQKHKIDLKLIECEKIFGNLIIPHSKQKEIEKLYDERYPEIWNKKRNSDRRSIA